MDLSLIVNSISDSIIRKTLRHDILDGSLGVFVAEKGEVPESSMIYVAKAADVKDFLARVPASCKITLFSAGDCGDTDYLSAASGTNLISADMEFVKLLNCLYALTSRLRKYKDIFMQDIWETRTPLKLLDHGAQLLKAPLYLLNHRLELIYSEIKYSINDICFESLNTTGRLPREFERRIMPLGDAPQNCSFTTNQGNLCLVRIVPTNDTAPFVLLSILPHAQGTPNDICVFEILVSYIAKQKSAISYDDSDTTLVLSRLLDALAGKESISHDELHLRLMRLQFPVYRFFSIILIVFQDYEHKLIPLPFLAQQLQTIFPNQNITVHDNRLVVLYCEDKHFNDPNINYGAFEKFLVTYNAYASVSNAISNWLKLYTNYTIARETLSIGRTITNVRSPQTRIFKYEDYANFFIINLCRKALCEMNFDEENLVYLGNPALTTLAIYDTLHHDNLMEVLYCYLQNDKRIVETGRKLYMHRNTVRKKLNTISEIMKVDINDPKVQFRLYFSCILHEYFRKYMSQAYRASVSTGTLPLWPTFSVDV